MWFSHEAVWDSVSVPGQVFSPRAVTEVTVAGGIRNIRAALLSNLD